MSIAFHFGNSIKILRRRWRSTLRIMLSAMCATVAAALAIAGYFATKNQLDELSEKILFSVFFSKDVTEENISAHAELLQKENFVDSLRIISPQEAKEKFFANDDAPNSLLLPDNPFPYVAEVTLKKDFRSDKGIFDAQEYFRSLPDVDDVIYKADFADAVLRRSQETILLSVVVGVIAFMLFLFILRNALRSEMTLAKSEIQVLHVMGAGRIFIAMPHIFFALISSFLGILIGAGVSAGMFFALKNYLPWINKISILSIGIAALGIYIIAKTVSIMTALDAAKWRVRKTKSRNIPAHK